MASFVRRYRSTGGHDKATFITLTRYTPTTAIHVNMDNVLTIEADEKGSVLISVTGETIAVNEKPDRIMQLIADERDWTGSIQ